MRRAPHIPITPIMPTAARPEGLSDVRLYRVLTWLSPGFPIGAYSYSHGLETAADYGTVHDRTTLQHWIAAVVALGAGRMDADTLRDGHRGASAQNLDALASANRRGLAFRATAEMAVETTPLAGPPGPIRFSIAGLRCSKKPATQCATPLPSAP